MATLALLGPDAVPRSVPQVKHGAHGSASSVAEVEAGQQIAAAMPRV